MAEGETVAGGTIKIVNHSAKLIHFTDFDADESISQIIASAARVSTQKKPLSFLEAQAFCRKLMSWGHWSPFEFFDMTFECETSRAVSHELVRHRLASFMQESQRYCDYSAGLRVIMPRAFESSLTLLHRFHSNVISSYEDYLAMLHGGAKPEDARVVLPECTATRIFVKMNLREFRHFLNLRTAKAAWSEMRELANAMADRFRWAFAEEKYLIEF